VSGSEIDSGKPLDRIMGVGAEIAFTIPNRQISISWRGYYQFAARDRLQGYISFLELRFGF
jgi:hypothetical protein